MSAPRLSTLSLFSLGPQIHAANRGLEPLATVNEAAALSPEERALFVRLITTAPQLLELAERVAWSTQCECTEHPPDTDCIGAAAEMLLERVLGRPPEGVS